MKSISLVAYNRPDYLAQTLASMRQVDWTGYRLFVSLEAGAPDRVRRLCAEIDWVEKEVHVAVQKMGCDRNTYRSICMPFDAGSDFNIYMEDDVEISRGLRNLADWYADYDDQENVCLCTESFTDRTAPTNELRLFKSFNSHGLMCTKAQFEKHIRSKWLDHSLSYDTTKGWDWNMMNYVTRYSNSHIVAPMHAYTHHIGVSGTYCNRKMYEASGQHLLPLCHDIHSTFFINHPGGPADEPKL